MTRVKRGTIANKRRKNVLKMVKGYRHGRKSKERMAKDAIAHAGAYAFAHRRKKKRVMRAKMQIKINAASRENGISYSKLMGKLKKEEIGLDRKVLSQLAENNPEIFKQIAATAN
ncbi:TPA: 50S ribosomal protein L20 [Patescibacteria group bacterium]|nr:MAG: 50S ribosomal protein L20 [Parcubacteria group bacterium GW2011_GWF2_40_10]KKR47471.1 MAG: 50S ribosomal protein L20 [Parcubacteria group bacterium GW2011_GWA2_40_143]KKR58968.1 MAG: 50S ribosomal protein L20 [Parcubacteria group bacterium GW2011_GWC2_40_31]KKR76008.1 MAG: 50S ribosomal protein L20 [Parcubacteria group bacterium GW2011_GWE2_40_8]KKR82197.1 MAG: 50S ribosomal protein L20 [Parcubacteria group bacterium GW2011_GWD2_40_9]MDP3902206.1 50S ribosomal protein L20 [bacterium]H